MFLSDFIWYYTKNDAKSFYHILALGVLYKKGILIPYFHYNLFIDILSHTLCQSFGKC
jgi:hypothetical protein